jgi:putative ABC transport system permease protein
MKNLFADGLAQDVRVSVRTLLRAPVLTLTILLTVGLGIGATTVIFGAVDAALLRPLPYPNPSELVRIYTDARPYRFRFSVADYLALEAEQTHFSHVAAYTDRAMAFSDGAVAERLRGRLVTSGYFDLVGIRPALGRGFEAADARPGAAPSVILSHGFWRERLGARDSVIGTAIRLDGADHTVVGVLPDTVGPLEYRQDFFVAARLEPPPRKGPFFLIVLGRLPSGTSPSSAGSELHAINRRMFPIWQSSYQDERATWGMMDLKRYLIGDSAPMALIALAAVALVWLIASANASSLMVARVASRQRELAVRAALGASRRRLLRHLLVESAVLALGSAAIGLAVATVGVGAAQVVAAGYIPRTEEIALEGRVLWVLAALSIASLLLFGLIPAARRAGQRDDTLRDSGRTATASAAARRARQVLAASQFAIATPLLIAAALLIVTLNELRRVDIGFDTRNVITGSLQLPAAQYPDDARTETFWRELHRRLAAHPAVTGAAFAEGRPPADVGDFNNFDLEQFPTAPGQSQPVTPWLGVTPEYFGVLGVSLVEGRLFDERDGRNPDLDVVIVDRAWARRFFPTESAVGKRLRGGGCTQCPWTTVVGVVTDVKYAGLDQPAEGSVYRPLTGSRFRNFILRTRTDPHAVIPTVRQMIRELDPSLPLTSVATADELIEDSIERPRVLSLLVGGFAAIALVLSTIGIYGVMAYYVQQHAKEIGIRLALGGSPRDVLRLIVERGMAVIAGGVAVGLAAAFALTRWMSSLLFGISTGDVFTFTTVSVFLLIAGAAACLLPARRAMRLEPAAVLRSE